MENKKTIEYLNGTAWYRAVKAVYVLAVALSLALSVLVLFVSGDSEVWWFIGIIVITAIVVRGTFYYIVLGTINPKK